MIAMSAVGVFLNNLGLVLGKSPGAENIEKILHIAESNPDVLEVVGPLPNSSV